VCLLEEIEERAAEVSQRKYQLSTGDHRALQVFPLMPLLMEAHPWDVLMFYIIEGILLIKEESVECTLTKSTDESNLQVQLSCWRAGLPSRRTKTCWRNETETS